MWLLNTSTYMLKEPTQNEHAPYAILSHTWSSDEVLFEDMRQNLAAAREKDGWSKVETACKQAKLEKYEWIWIDTCCIDKKSSAELTEAINSMFQWYQNAAVCYAFFQDFSKNENDSRNDNLEGMSNCRWFKRGWTLQELLASKNMQFYDSKWKLLG
jgi:hypothetical protein